MSKTIFIGSVEVPVADYAVGASAILGIRDSGKTVTAKGIAEQLLDNGIPIVVFDAVGKWRWMKVPGHRPHERGKGYKVVVAGGNAPDLPLTIHSVPEIVRAALKERIPLIIDLYDKNLSKGDWKRIVQTAIHIIHYENEGGPVHVFLEEAAEFVPQKVMDGVTYAEVEKLVRMGGNASVGITLINQRSQEVNKAVLDNCSTALILGCQVGDRAIQAVSSWVEKLDKETAKEVTASLPSLQSGEAWFWTRKNLTKPSREKMPMCQSYHPDRRTPEETLKQVVKGSTDTAAFVARMSEAIPKALEEAKANDPAELKRKVRELEQKLRLEQQKAPVAQQSEPKEVPVFDEESKGLLSRYETACNMFYDVVKGQVSSIQEMTKQLNTLRGELLVRFKSPLAGSQATHRVTARNETLRTSPQVNRGPSPTRPAGGDLNGTIPAGEKRVLIAAAQYLEGVTREQLTVLTGFKRSTRDAYIARLREKGYLTVDGVGNIFSSEPGITALGTDFEPLPTGQALVEYWRKKLPEGERLIWEYAMSNHPGNTNRDELDAEIGFKRSTRDAYIFRLAAKKLIEIVGPGQIRASKIFFE